MMKSKIQKLAKNVNNTLFNVWLSFSVFASLISIVMIIFGSNWNHDDPYLYGGIISLALLPALLVKESVTYLSNQQIGNKVFWFSSLFFAISLVLIDMYFILGEGSGALLGLGIVLAILSPLQYLFIKYLINKNIIVTLVNILGITYAVLFLLKVA